MDAASLDPFGAALHDYLDGDVDATLLLHRDDGFVSPLPAGYFFGPASDFSALERRALERCAGRVLDCGAGAGRHALELQKRGLDVTAIDVCPAAVDVMRRRGVRDACVADAFAFDGGPFDTVLLLGHTIGLVGTLERLDEYLRVLDRLVAPAGQVIFDSADVLATDDLVHLAYHEAKRRAGRYVGEIRMAVEYRGVRGPFQGWLLLDEATLAAHALPAGWGTERLAGEATENLFRLTRSGTVER